MQEPVGPMAICLKRDGMDGPRCDCLFDRFKKDGYSQPDTEAFLKGKSSQMSDFSVYFKMAKHLWECEAEVVKASRGPKMAADGSGHGDPSALKPLKNPKPYKHSSLFINNCPNYYLRDPSYCACVENKSKVYMHEWEFEALTHKTLAIASVPNHRAKFSLLKQFLNQCEKGYTGKKMIRR